ncbi:kinase-like domain-containing protein [Xylaria arbuscula]|nr:kinase-like domain-containing protein [Xylaria arbuscula]
MAFQEHEELEQRLRRFFSDDPRFLFVKDLPSGATGHTVCYQQRFTGGGTRRIVLKYTNDDDDIVIRAIENERKWLSVLRTAQHVVNLLYIFRGPQPDGTGIENAFMILEYLENGSLAQFAERTGREAIPNRILWSIFLCLTRACIALAWPAQGDEPEIPTNAVPQALAHWDMHGDNLLFARMTGDPVEHAIIPMLKLIDFDNSGLVEVDEDEDLEAIQLFDNGILQLGRFRTRRGQRNRGTDMNVLDMGLTMARMIAKERALELDDCRAFMQYAHPMLDQELHLLILRCLAVDPRNRPTLEELLLKCINGFDPRRYDGKPYEDRETDWFVRMVVQHCMFDPDDN